jgi:photosystem II stability/assembly factor-like uncharacterized protein
MKTAIKITTNAALIWSLLFIGTFTSCTDNQSPNVKVQFVSSRVGWIVGPRLLQTTDAGQTWVELRDEGYGTLQAEDIFQGRNWMQFLNNEVGFSVGGSGIARTFDGGRTWTSIIVTSGNDHSLRSLFFVSPQEGWVVGNDVYHTSDGGNRWTRLSKTPLGDEPKQRRMEIAPTYAINNPSLWFTTEKNGYMARLDGEIYLTVDGGRTWELAWKGDKSIADIFFVNSQDGVIVGEGGLVARTADGGKTWSVVEVPTKADLTSVFFLNKKLGCAVGYDSTILYTNDGGATWKHASIAEELKLPLASVAFSDETHGWAVGGANDPMAPSIHAPSNVILATNDGGRTWRRVSL